MRRESRLEGHARPRAGRDHPRAVYRPADAAAVWTGDLQLLGQRGLRPGEVGAGRRPGWRRRTRAAVCLAGRWQRNLDRLEGSRPGPPAARRRPAAQGLAARVRHAAAGTGRAAEGRKPARRDHARWQCPAHRGPVARRAEENAAGAAEGRGRAVDAGFRSGRRRADAGRQRAAPAGGGADLDDGAGTRRHGRGPGDPRCRTVRTFLLCDLDAAHPRRGRRNDRTGACPDVGNSVCGRAPAPRQGRGGLPVARRRRRKGAGTDSKRTSWRSAKRRWPKRPPKRR